MKDVCVYVNPLSSNSSLIWYDNGVLERVSEMLALRSGFSCTQRAVLF